MRSNTVRRGEGRREGPVEASKEGRPDKATAKEKGKEILFTSLGSIKTDNEMGYKPRSDKSSSRLSVKYESQK